LEKELHDKRKKMASIIESANSAYEERDNANTQILSLKTQAKKEAADFEKELKDVSHVMEKNKKALDFIKQAERHREETQTSNDPDLEKKNIRNPK
jgi:coiled-coil domain-containing protein 63/114